MYLTLVDCAVRERRAATRALPPRAGSVRLQGMGQHELTQKLAQLHQELSQTEKVDPENLELLRKLTADIGRLVARQGATAPDDEAEEAAGGLKDLLLKFEADHPELSISLGKVADALAAIGI